MLHEVILALNGTSGNVLQKITEMPEFQTDVHPSERALLLAVLEVSENYKFLKTFIDAVPMIGDSPILLGDNQLLPGMYLRAFCDGLYEGLKPYRSNIVNLEKFILEEPYATLSSIMTKMGEFVSLVDSLKTIVQQLITRQIHGCKILQHIYVHTMVPGKTMFTAALVRITQKCHQVMLKQLTSWMLYGNPMDPYKEFFIQIASTGTDGLYASFSTIDSESLHEAGEYEQIVYKLVVDLLPSYIPLSLANKALYIGNTINMFSKENLDKNKGGDMSRHLSIYSQTESILLGRLQALHSSNKLDINLLENTINDVRSCVTQHFWTLAKDVADVYGQLKLCKDFYLLGQGQVFLMFLRKAAHILQMPVSTHNNRDLNNILQSTARLLLNNETVLDKFYFNLPSKDSTAAGTTVWSALKLEFKVSWPLHLLFTPPVINNYNVLFRFLLKVKKAELNLHDVWIASVKKKSEKFINQELQLCNMLMFLIQNLQCYLQLDVIDSQDSIFQNMLKVSSDFEQIMQSHNTFLANIISQSFLQPVEIIQQGQPSFSNPHAVNTLIGKILELSEDFCSVVSQNDSDKEELEKIAEKVDILVSSLMSLMMDLSTNASGSHLFKLLMRLDYNHFFSNKPDQSSIMSVTM